MPFTVEPSKPRLCHDERYLNLWIRDLPFVQDTLKDVPRIIPPDSFMTTVDDKVMIILFCQKPLGNILGFSLQAGILYIILFLFALKQVLIYIKPLV